MGTIVGVLVGVSREIFILFLVGSMDMFSFWGEAFSTIVFLATFSVFSKVDSSSLFLLDPRESLD